MTAAAAATARQTATALPMWSVTTPECARPTNTPSARIASSATTRSLPRRIARITAYDTSHSLQAVGARQEGLRAEWGRSAFAVTDLLTAA